MRMKVWMAVACLLFATPVFAWHLDGCVVCDENRNGVCDSEDTPLAGVFFIIENTAGTFYDTELTGKDGCFYQSLPDYGDTYTMTVDKSTLPEGAVVLLPGSDGVLKFTVDDTNSSFTYCWLINCHPEDHEACWLTGGGVKFDSICGMKVAEGGPLHNFGGNIYPSCSPYPGDGGNWNHVAHDQKLHFQAREITKVECGNVEGIEPGSESPVTPFNYLEFWGTGTLKGIKGNKVDYGTVYCHGRCEDRNEPGSNGAKDGVDIDRYFLHVYSDPSDPEGSALLLVDIDGDPSTVDPLKITGGNLQIHISSCDDPPAWAK